MTHDEDFASRMNTTTVLFTGSTDGIGRQCALELAKSGATVLLHGRDGSRGKSVLEDIRKVSGNANVDLVIADFRSLAHVRRMAAEILDKYSRLDVLVNNAGTYLRKHEMTEDSFESTFAVNHLAPFLLTNLLLDLLKKCAPAKIINVSSMAHQQGRFDVTNLQAEKHFDAYGAYALSKLANLMFTYELARRLEGSGVTVNALHPGVISTKLLRAGFGSFGGRPVKDGADRIMHLIRMPHDANVTGRYFVDDKEAVSSTQACDPRLQKELWLLSEKLTGDVSA